MCLQKVRCLHDLWATLVYILCTPHRKTPRWSPFPSIASFSILDRSVRQSGHLRRFHASPRGSAGVQPTKYVCVSSHWAFGCNRSIQNCPPSNLFLSWLTSTLRCQMSEFFDINLMVWTRLICNFCLFMQWHKPHSTISLFTSWDWVSKMMSKLAPAAPAEKGERMGYQRDKRLQGMDKESKSSFETLFFASSLHLTK